LWTLLHVASKNPEPGVEISHFVVLGVPKLAAKPFLNAPEKRRKRLIWEPRAAKKTVVILEAQAGC
jgi:hypothetical protein